MRAGHHASIGTAGRRPSAAVPQSSPQPSLQPPALQPPALTPDFDILLKPISHPELGEIRIDENLFAVGRSEQPFASYGDKAVGDLSRRHARIFSEYGAVYIADLGSKNGTTLNGIELRHKNARLRDGDELCFGHSLSYRVQLGTRAQTRERPARLTSVTLEPVHPESGLQPIVISQFPFLVSKGDAAFSRYKESCPEQVNYLSRRHAHLFQKAGKAFVEDLGSTNGTFVNGKRLDEHAVALEEGCELAFGGHHFVYKVALQQEQAAAEPTMTKFAAAPPAAGRTDGGGRDQDDHGDKGDHGDKTTFVAAASSFLDIFCAPVAGEQDGQPDDAAGAESADGKQERKAPKGRLAAYREALHASSSAAGKRRPWSALRWGVPLALLLAAVSAGLLLGLAPEQQVKDLLAAGDYAGAAALAEQSLDRHPGNAGLQGLGSEALLKANVPAWLGSLQEGDFEGARAALARIKQHARHNPDAQAMAKELEWLGTLEEYVAVRGGVDAPVRMYADEPQIRALLARWNADPQAHQRALGTIAVQVPAFRERYAEALSHLRQLQNDDSVYLAAIDRLNDTVRSELARDRPEALQAVVKEYAERYPRLSGLDRLQQDLQQYIAIDGEARARRLGPLIALLKTAQFSTPPFRARLQALSADNRLPSPAVIQQYEAASEAWRAGDADRARDALQALRGGPWDDVAAAQLERRKAIVQGYAELQKARGGKDYDERLLAFYGSLNPDEDSYFVRASQAEVLAYKDKALVRARGLLDSAQAAWNRYRQNGAIGGEERLESGVSGRYRSQARLLSGARRNAQQGMRIVHQLKADYPEQWNKTQAEIEAEAELQQRSLLELQSVLEPGLLKTKLSLLGGRNDGQGKPAEAAD